jgi:hypothetical protein
MVTTAFGSCIAGLTDPVGVVMQLGCRARGLVLVAFAGVGEGVPLAG